MGRAAQDWARAHDADATAKVFENIYAEVTEVAEVLAGP